MNQSSLKLMEYMHQKMEYMDQKEEKNPRQIFIDWAENVRQYATKGNYALKKDNGSKSKSIDTASDYFNSIIGACDTMLTILKIGV